MTASKMSSPSITHGRDGMRRCEVPSVHGRRVHPFGCCAGQRLTHGAPERERQGEEGRKGHRVDREETERGRREETERRRREDTERGDKERPKRETESGDGEMKQSEEDRESGESRRRKEPPTARGVTTEVLECTRTLGKKCICARAGLICRRHSGARSHNIPPATTALRERAVLGATRQPRAQKAAHGRKRAAQRAQGHAHAQGMKWKWRWERNVQQVQPIFSEAQEKLLSCPATKTANGSHAFLTASTMGMLAQQSLREQGGQRRPLARKGRRKRQRAATYAKRPPESTKGNPICATNELNTVQGV